VLWPPSASGPVERKATKDVAGVARFRLLCLWLGQLHGDCSIRVHRDPGAWRVRARSYKILLEGTTAGSVKRGETVLLNTNPGSHRLQVAIDRGRSPTVDLELKPGDDVVVRCWPHGNSFAALYWITFCRKRYIGLVLTESP
jgi:hypothetical protein